MGICGSKDADSTSAVVSRVGAPRREFTGKPVMLVRPSDEVMRENENRERLALQNKKEFDAQERQLDEELASIEEAIARLAGMASPEGPSVIQTARMKALLIRKSSTERMLSDIIEQRAGVESLSNEMRMANFNKRLMTQTDVLAKSGSKIVYDIKKVEKLSENVDTAATNASEYNSEVKDATVSATPSDVMLQVDEAAVQKAFSAVKAKPLATAPKQAQAAFAMRTGVPLPATGTTVGSSKTQSSRYARLEEDAEAPAEEIASVHA